MIYITDINAAIVKGNSIVTLGKFDGLHRGHRQLFKNLYKKKIENGWTTVAFTFNIGLLFFKYGENFKSILEVEERKRKFEKLAVDMVIECPFSEEIRNMDAEDFVKDIIIDKLHAACIVVGKDFTFGHERKGNYTLLKQLAEKYGFEVFMIDEVYEDGERISSTNIRREIACGNIEKANKMLGYPFSVEGIIRTGQRLGRTIDMPTINLIPGRNKLLPPFGVYSSITKIDGKFYKGVTNIGRKPTVGEFAVGVETHLFDVSADFYDKFARVSLFHFQRPERKFNSVDELKIQMHKDAADAVEYLNTLKGAF